MFLTYSLITILLTGLLLVYFVVARRFNIIDYPAERSSHTRPTIRGGGILFPVAGLIWFVLFRQQEPWAIAGLLLISLVSFWDDVQNIRASIRFLVHFVAVTMLFYQLGIFEFYWYWYTFAYILTIGCINAVNFMDGINGITAFYSLVTLGTFSMLNNARQLLQPLLSTEIPADWQSFLPERLVGVLFIAMMVFAFFNARKRAYTFAGDVGSISIAFIMSWFLIKLMVVSHDFYWILLVAVYGIDTAYTIALRIRRGENILKPHRLHLYQLLANEKGWPQIPVAMLFAAVQLLVNLITIWLMFNGIMNSAVFLIFLGSLTVIYIAVRPGTPSS
jgi:UDP-GlcNAc:undecaprenyl-phosphate/decaprenyl-phosphate GlcNAc-1-phosphate transferase